MAAAGLPDQARLAFQGRADASLDELLPCCTIKRRAEDFVVDEIDEDGQRASEAMTRAPEATLKPALEDLAAKLDSRQQEPAADVDESDGEDALSALDEATLDALRAFDAGAKDQVLRDGIGAAPMSVALPDGGNRLNLRLALEKGFPWTRVRLESGAVEADLRLKPLATILSADDVERLQRFGRTRGSKAAASIEAPADKDARRAVHTTLAAAFRACETKTLDAVWKSTSELGYVNLYAIEQARSRGRRRVDGVGRPKFDIHTGSTGARSRRGGAAAGSGGATARAGRSSSGASWRSATRNHSPS